MGILRGGDPYYTGAGKIAIKAFPAAYRFLIRTWGIPTNIVFDGSFSRFILTRICHLNCSLSPIPGRFKIWKPARGV